MVVNNNSKRKCQPISKLQTPNSKLINLSWSNFARNFSIIISHQMCARRVRMLKWKISFAIFIFRKIVDTSSDANHPQSNSNSRLDALNISIWRGTLNSRMHIFHNWAATQCKCDHLAENDSKALNGNDFVFGFFWIVI